MSRFLLLVVLVASILSACNQAKGSITPDSPLDAPQSEPVAEGSYDPIDDFFREGAGVIEGDITLNGAVETDPNYDTSPQVVAQNARNGDIAIYRIRGKLSDSATTTLYTKQSSATKNYSSLSIPGTNVDQYKAMYVTGTEPLLLTFYNSNNFNTPLNAKAAIFDYNYKTQAAENAGEPNDDDNGATITDRTLANNLPLGFLATRSVFSFDPTKRDLEEWYKTTITAGEKFNFNFTTVSGRFGTWSYTMKVFDPSGVQLGTTTNIAAGASSAAITRTATTTGTYSLQLVGTPLTKNNTNLFFNLYTISACLPPKVDAITFTSDTCAEAPRTWSVAFGSPTIEDDITSYAWNFGGGFSPNTSTKAEVPGTLDDEPGGYIATLTVKSSCGTTVFTQPYTVGCRGWAGAQGGPLGTVTPVDIAIAQNDNRNRAHVLGYYTGTVDLDPSAGVSPAASGGQQMFVMTLDADGRVLGTPQFIGGSALSEVTPVSLAYQSEEAEFGAFVMTGTYEGTVDFDPGDGVVERNSVTDGNVFVMGLAGVEPSKGDPDPNPIFDWVATFSQSSGTPSSVAFRAFTTEAAIVGSFGGTTDFDPGFSTFSRTSVGGQDAYLMLFDGTGHFLNGATWGGAGTDIARGIACAEDGIYPVGDFVGTVDFDPTAGIANLTGSGTSAGFLARYSPSGNTFVDASAFNGTGTVTARNIATGSQRGLRIVGSYTGTTDFDPGVGVVNQTSNGQTDAFIVGLNLDTSFEWIFTLGGTGNDSAVDVATQIELGKVVVVGNWSGTVDLNPTTDVDTRIAAGGADALTMQFKDFGSFQRTVTWAGTGNELPVSLGLDFIGAQRIIGTFNSTVDFDPGPDVFNLSPLNTQDSFVEKIMENGSWDPE